MIALPCDSFGVLRIFMDHYLVSLFLKVAVSCGSFGALRSNCGLLIVFYF